VHKYLKAPSLTEIDAFIKELGISDLQFERYYRMASRTIDKVRRGYRPLPRKYWHYIYEKSLPEYAIGYKLNTKKHARVIARDKRQRKKVVNVNRLTSL
jgi:hypothetical protein